MLTDGKIARLMCENLAPDTRKATKGYDIEALCRAIEAAVRAELAVQEPAAWQPIETAPRDGTSIIVYTGSTVGQARWWRETRYCEGSVRPTEPAGFYWAEDGHKSGLCRATHWRPIPTYAPPVVQPDMVLVPGEPTDAMLVAATEVNKTLNAEQIVFLYRAMIAAAEKEQK